MFFELTVVEGGGQKRTAYFNSNHIIAIGLEAVSGGTLLTLSGGMSVVVDATQDEIAQLANGQLVQSKFDRNLQQFVPQTNK